MKRGYPLYYGITNVDLWVRILFLPFCFHNDQALASIIHGNRVGTFIRSDENSSVKNKRRLARVCINTSFPNPPAFLHINHPTRGLLSFQLWYEGFSEGCGSCGAADHSYEDCFIHNLVATPQQFTPRSSSFAVENARATRLHILNELMAHHFLASNVARPPSFVRKNSASAAQKKTAALTSAPRALLPAPPILISATITPGSVTSFLQSSPMNSRELAHYTSEMLSRLHQEAIISNPVYQGMPNFHGVSGSKKKKKAATKKLEVMEMETVTPQELDEDGSPAEVTFVSKGKEKEAETPAAKKQKRGKGQGIRISG